jgi:hypothetical protein
LEEKEEGRSWANESKNKKQDSIMEYMDQHHFNASKRTDISGE